MKNRKVISLFVCMVLIITLLPVQMVSAKSSKVKPKISATKKTITVGQQYKIKLKNAKKVKWKTSNSKIVTIKKKGSDYVTVKGKKAGKATITGTYKGKKYKCKITVKAKKKTQDPTKPSTPTTVAALNATDVTLYYQNADSAGCFNVDASHQNSFQFKVTGGTAKVNKWKITEGGVYASVDANGVVKGINCPAYKDEYAKITLTAYLTDGNTLTANIKLYSEDMMYVKQKIKEFGTTYLTYDMTEYQKMEKVAWYAGAMFDYQSGQSSFSYMMIHGGGDCMASRELVQELLQAQGMKAFGCYNLTSHGQTLVRADGKMYLVTTGYNEPKPRQYMITEQTWESASQIAAENNINIDYFK